MNLRGVEAEQKGATTFSIMTLIIIAFSITTFSIMGLFATLSIT